MTFVAATGVIIATTITIIRTSTLIVLIIYMNSFSSILWIYPYFHLHQRRIVAYHPNWIHWGHFYCIHHLQNQPIDPNQFESCSSRYSSPRGMEGYWGTDVPLSDEARYPCCPCALQCGWLFLCCPICIPKQWRGSTEISLITYVGNNLGEQFNIESIGGVGDLATRGKKR